MNGATINGSKIRVDPFRGDGVKRGDRGDGDIRGSKDGGYSSGDKRGDCGGGEYHGVRGDGFHYGGDRGSRYGKPSYGCGGVYRSRSTMGPSKKQRWLASSSFIPSAFFQIMPDKTRKVDEENKEGSPDEEQGSSDGGSTASGPAMATAQASASAQPAASQQPDPSQPGPSRLPQDTNLLFTDMVEPATSSDPPPDLGVEWGARPKHLDIPEERPPKEKSKSPGKRIMDGFVSIGSSVTSMVKQLLPDPKRKSLIGKDSPSSDRDELVDYEETELEKKTSAPPEKRQKPNLTSELVTPTPSRHSVASEPTYESSLADDSSMGAFQSSGSERKRPRDEGADDEDEETDREEAEGNEAMESGEEAEKIADEEMPYIDE
ncbi:hypothetical protein CEXT_462551 [Caerostris extrusa]|uniref:Uncharacterized protein n=1 Tax=Caerostris extrusa TaxID=172846 RepID=A0AAV4QVS7_CAEEX|nr:hypothetical protein CEXT_462551 [Caerostris extrusa]